MTTWHTPCAAGGLCQKPGGSDNAGPAHKCVECRLNVHTICSMSWDDPNASFGEDHKCFKCAGSQSPAVPPPAAAATSPQQPQEQDEEKERQELQRRRHNRFAASDMEMNQNHVQVQASSAEIHDNVGHKFRIVNNKQHDMFWWRNRWQSFHIQPRSMTTLGTDQNIQQ